MIPRLEKLEERCAPAAVDPVFQAGVTKLYGSLQSLYTGMADDLQKAAAGGIAIPPAYYQSVRDFGLFTAGLPAHFYSWYQTATPADIARVDALFLNMPDF